MRNPVCPHDPDQFVTSEGGTTYCPTCKALRIEREEYTPEELQRLREWRDAGNNQPPADLDPMQVQPFEVEVEELVCAGCKQPLKAHTYVYPPRCPVVRMPSSRWEEIERWRTAPSNTASAPLSCSRCGRVSSVAARGDVCGDPTAKGNPCHGTFR